MELYRDGASLVVAGQIDGRCTADLRDAIHERLDADLGDLVLDLGAVESADLAALRVIAVTSREAALHGQRILLRDAPPLVRRLLHLSRLRGLVTYESSAVTAV